MFFQKIAPPSFRFVNILRTVMICKLHLIFHFQTTPSFTAELSPLETKIFQVGVRIVY